MTDSLWNRAAQDLLRQASSADPTPGGGAIAALTAAFGFGLVQMAIEVTLAASEITAEDRARLAAARDRVAALQAEAVGAVDRDVAEFEAVMASYRLPRETDEQQAERGRAIDEATVTATHGPLGLAEAAISGIELVAEIEPLVKASIVSDAQAGRDLLRGAALAALRTADINLVALENRRHAEAPSLRRRRGAVSAVAAEPEDQG